MDPILLLIFFFVVGTCVGSFINVVVWRLPRVEFEAGEGWVRSIRRTLLALSYPPSRCPKCGTTLKWYDNIPVVGWLKLGGKCRHCKAAISLRYPIVEGACGVIFAGYYAALFLSPAGMFGPACPASFTPEGDVALHPAMIFVRDWPIFALYLILLGGLLAASLIDAELFIIPLEIPYIIAPIAFAVHTIVDRPNLPGALTLLSPASTALAAGAGAGLAISVVAWLAGWLPSSFPKGEPILEVEREAIEKELEADRRSGREIMPLPPAYTRRQINGEIRKEMMFLLPPMLMGTAWFALTYFGPLRNWWLGVMESVWLSSLLGSLLGAMTGAFIVWLARILGTLGFGRVAMGLGDVHLMFAVGAVVGGLAAVAAFFIAPFFAIVLALWAFLFRRHRELPFGPYLSLGSAVVILYAFRIQQYLAPGLTGLGIVVHRWIEGTGS